MLLSGAGLADAEGFLLLAPESQGPSWDLVMGDYGQDVAFLDQVLEQVFERYAVDPERVVLAGFVEAGARTREMLPPQQAMTTPPPEALPFPDSLCHRCAAPPRYVQSRTTTFIMCPLLPQKYPPQPVRLCALFRPMDPGPTR